MKKFLSIMMSVLLLVCVMVPMASAATPAEEAKLQFHEDGTFKIMNFSDIQDGASLMSLTADLIKAAIEAEDPDLIILTGDNVSGYRTLSAAKTEKGIRAYMDIFESYGIPVAIVFGNHDEDRSGLTKEEQMAIYNSYSCDISYDDGEDIWGCGTYNVPIYSSTDANKVAFNCWLFDTGARDENGDYDHMHQNQLDWYVEKSNELKAANGGEVVPSLAFQHIIVPEIFDALKEVPAGTAGAVAKYGKYYVLPDTAAPGSILGEPCCPSGANGGEFDTLLAQGDVLGIVSGHDHCNSFIVPYKGIDLINTPTCGFRSYGDNESRGVRVFTLNEADLTTYETYVVTFPELFEGNAMAMFRFNFLGIFSRIYAYFNNLWGTISSALGI